MSAYFDTSVFNTWYADVKPKYSEKRLNLRQVLAEVIGMTFFVFVGTATAVNFSSSAPSAYAEQNAEGDAELDATTGNVTELTNDRLQKALSSRIDAAENEIVNVLKINASFGIITALAFGMAIMVLAYSLGHISGAHFNPAVTLSLVLSGNCNVIQGAANVGAQVVGAILGSAFVWGVVPGGNDTGLGANTLSSTVSVGSAVVGEAVMTAMLCFVVHMCCCDPMNTGINPMAPLAIGFTVFLAHAVLIPLDGCSINPARSLGPAILANEWDGGKFWAFAVVGPFVGSFFGVLWWLLVSRTWDQKDVFEANAAAKRAADGANVTYETDPKLGTSPVTTAPVAPAVTVAV